MVQNDDSFYQDECVDVKRLRPAAERDDVIVVNKKDESVAFMLADDFTLIQTADLT